MPGDCDFSLYELSYNLPAGGGVVDLSNKYLVLATKVAAPPTMESCAEDKVIAEAAIRLAADDVLTDDLEAEVATRTLLSDKVDHVTTGLATKASAADLATEIADRKVADIALQTTFNTSAPVVYSGKYSWFQTVTSSTSNERFINWSAVVNVRNKTTSLKIEPTVIQVGHAAVTTAYFTIKSIYGTMPSSAWPKQYPIVYTPAATANASLDNGESFLVCLLCDDTVDGLLAAIKLPSLVTVNSDGRIQFSRADSGNIYPANYFIFFPSVTLTWINQY